MLTRPNLLLLFSWLLLYGTVMADGPDSSPSRVVSLDYCSDQFVIQLLPRSRILAVSTDADRQCSYLREQAVGIDQVRPRAENVLVLEPDLIVRSYGGGPNARQFFERAGVPVLQVPFADDIESIRRSVLHISRELGEPERGLELVREMDRRLQNIAISSPTRTALYMTPAGVTSGPDSLVHEMLLAAGLTNFEKRPGWRPIPLERLAYEGPDMVAAAFFDARTNRPSMWSAMRHPVASRQIDERTSVMLQGAWTSCGGWFLLDAIEALAVGSSTVKDSQPAD
jgi:iron complex transport system substrate-binding protein